MSVQLGLQISTHFWLLHRANNKKTCACSAPAQPCYLSERVGAERQVESCGELMLEFRRFLPALMPREPPRAPVFPARCPGCKPRKAPVGLRVLGLRTGHVVKSEPPVPVARGI